MNPDRTKLKQEHRAEETSQQIQNSETQAQVKEFANADDLLRFDSEQNPVPPEVADRLGRSLAAEPKPEKSWFKKLFGN